MTSRVSTAALARAHDRAAALAGAHDRAVRRGAGSGSRVRPGRMRRIDRSRVAGRGQRDFGSATAALLSFRVHRAAGIDVYPPDADAADGLIVVLGIGRARLAILAPCRVTHCWDGERSAGFRYETLRGHPESGWEEFSVTLDDDGVVRFGIVAESTPAWAVLRPIAPAQNLVQDRITRAYLSAMAGLVTESHP